MISWDHSFLSLSFITPSRQGKWVGHASGKSERQNTRYMRNETERLNPQNLPVVVISDTPCAMAMMRYQAGGSVRLVVCTPMSHSEQREKCISCISVYHTLWHCFNFSSISSMFGVAKFAWAMPNLG